MQAWDRLRISAQSVQPPVCVYVCVGGDYEKGWQQQALIDQHTG